MIAEHGCQGVFGAWYPPWMFGFVTLVSLLVLEGFKPKLFARTMVMSVIPGMPGGQQVPLGPQAQQQPQQAGLRSNCASWAKWSDH